MRAMVIERRGAIVLRERPDPEPGPAEVRVRVEACAVCRTDLHVLDGDLDEGKSLPIIPGHEIVGRVDRAGPLVTELAVGTRVGIPWLASTCGRCAACTAGRENLCDEARFTGWTRDGGFAEFVVADPRFCFPLDEDADAMQIAPWLCAGLIGYRAWRMCGDADAVGFYGFGAAAHILAQVAVFEGRRVHAFTRPGDTRSQAFARDLGAVWAGSSDEAPPEPLDAAILFAPVGELVPLALRAVHKGGVVVCAGIHMSDIPSFPYASLWGERVVRSVANLTRQDGIEFLELAPRVPVRTEVHPYRLEDAGRALEDLRHGRFDGAAVIVIDA